MYFLCVGSFCIIFILFGNIVYSGGYVFVVVMYVCMYLLKLFLNIMDFCKVYRNGYKI